MDTKFIDGHTADIIAALRKRGTSPASRVPPPWTGVLPLWQTPSPWPKGAINYRDGAGYASVGNLAFTLSCDPITHEFIDRSRDSPEKGKKRTAGITHF